jgi:hypothetical protein
VRACAEQAGVDAEAERLARTRIELDAQSLEALRQREQAEAEAQSLAEIRLRAESTLLTQARTLIEAERVAEAAAAKRLDTENEATRVLRDKLEAEAEATQRNKVRIETERKADAAAQARLEATEELQREIALQRETARQAGAKRRSRFRVEWQAFYGSLRVMGQRWLGVSTLLLLLTGVWLGFSLRAAIDESGVPESAVWAGEPAACPATPGAAVAADASHEPGFLATLFAGKESGRLADMPTGLRLDDDFASFGAHR